MRALLVASAALALAACGKNDQSGTAMNAGENLTAESIASNDVTAIDAVTGDAANMAADVDMNFESFDQNSTETVSNAPVAGPAPKKAAPKPAKPAETNMTNSVANTASNAE